MLLDVVGTGDHCAQLEDAQRSSAIADALLAVDRRARGLQSDDQAEQCDRNQADDNHAQREGDVEGALHEAVAQAPVGAGWRLEGPLGLARELGGEEGDVGCLEFIRVYITALIE